MTAQAKPDNIDISELLADLKKGFITDIPVRLDEMESIILAMEKAENFTENYEALYRHAHSLKGSAGTYGLHIITSICHALEDVLNEVGRDNNYFAKYGADYWLQYIDLIRAVLASISKDNHNFEKFENDLKALQSITPAGKSFQLHCLVVSSSSIYENMLPRNFEKDNIKFSFCDDGYKALGRLLTESFELLISDYEVPLLNGQALFGSLRLSNSKNKKIKTILLTSKQPRHLNRNTDPDYVVQKDKDFTDNLATTIRNIAREYAS